MPDCREVARSNNVLGSPVDDMRSSAQIHRARHVCSVCPCQKTGAVGSGLGEGGRSGLTDGNTVTRWAQVLGPVDCGIGGRWGRTLDVYPPTGISTPFLHDIGLATGSAAYLPDFGPEPYPP